MAVTFDLPQDIEQTLRRDFGDASEGAKESALIELYRQRRITHADLSHALSISRLEVEAVLKKHNVTEDLPTAAEHQAVLEPEASPHPIKPAIALPHKVRPVRVGADPECHHFCADDRQQRAADQGVDVPLAPEHAEPADDDQLDDPT